MMDEQEILDKYIAKYGEPDLRTGDYVWKMGSTKLHVATSTTINSCTEVWLFYISSLVGWVKHRRDGPAVVHYNGEGEITTHTYFWKGVKIDLGEYLTKITSSKVHKNIIRDWL